jgi:HAE1 family hydrophobic/amphiphilic exporter-1
VAEVNVVGGVERELTVEVDPQRMQSPGSGIRRWCRRCSRRTWRRRWGGINGALDERTIRLRGRLKDAASSPSSWSPRARGRIIRLGEIATVRDGTEEARSVALFNGRPAVGINVVKSQGSSTTAVSERVIAALGELQATLPAGVKLDVVQNAGERVENSVENVQATLLGGRRPHRAGRLPLPQLVAEHGDHRAGAAGVGAGLVHGGVGLRLHAQHDVAAGPLARHRHPDRRRHRGARNIVRHVEMGKDHYTAAAEGTDEIGLAVAATTFSIVCVFVPIAFMGSLAEQWFAPFALTIACSVLVSLFVSFSLDPMLSAYWPDPHVPESTRSGGSRGRWTASTAGSTTRRTATGA